MHSSSNGFDFSRNPAFGFVGQAFVAQFGDQAPVTGKTLAPVGFTVVRVDVSSGIIKDFAVNKGGVNGPASRIGGGGLERPVSARFDPSGTALYVVDFGVMTMGQGSEPRTETEVAIPPPLADAAIESTSARRSSPSIPRIAPLPAFARRQVRSRARLLQLGAQAVSLRQCLP